MHSILSLLLYTVLACSVTIATSPSSTSEPSTTSSNYDSILGANIAAVVSSASLAPYATPLVTDTVIQFGAYGDSFTAGIGSNGLLDFEGHSFSCSRYKQSYPRHMERSTRWPGDPAQRKLSFGACTGETIAGVRDYQLTDRNVSAGGGTREPFGQPQLGIMTISGNDLFFGDIIRACIFNVFIGFGNLSCDELLHNAEEKMNSIEFQGELDELFLAVKVKGQNNRGANPPESFQLFINGYVGFFNHDDSACNDVSFALFPAWFGRAPLTTELRKRLNDLVASLNYQLARSALRLNGFGIFYFDGHQSAYNGHRFCEPGATESNQMTNNVWFWHYTSPWNNGDEGPDPSAITTDPTTPLGDEILQALIPNVTLRTALYEGHANISDYFANNTEFWTAVDNIGFTNDPQSDGGWLPLDERTRRLFHPKGSAYAQQADLLIDFILSTRQGQPPQVAPPPPPPPAPASPPPAADICGDWYKVALDKFEIYGKNFQEDNWGQGLLQEIRNECGPVTDWKWWTLDNDPQGYHWYASGFTIIGKKSCVGHAVVAAGGASPDGCTGAG